MKKIMLSLGIIILLTVLFTNSYAQKPQRDKGQMLEHKNEFWDEIQKSVNEFNKKDEPPKKTFWLDFSTIDCPKTVDEFKKIWHTPPVPQASTNTCWCFSTTSLLESEVYRLHKKEMKFSEMFTVYWEYVEKARRFVQEHGNSFFAEGSQANAVTRMWKKYGCVPEDSYTGLKPGQKFHAHDKLISELTNYLQGVKSANNWNEEQVLSTVKSILNYHLGEPPTEITVKGEKMTPLEYLQNVVKINPDDYVDIMSLMESTYWQKAEYKADDNWWHSNIYNNVPLDEYMTALKTAVKNGYTAFIGGDVSESGYEGHAGIAVVPTYDIPSDYIDENAREFRYSNKTTTDDHGIHIVGYTEKNGKTWFLVKDSGSGVRNNSHPGYFFYHEDYIKLKMMNFMVHRSAVEDLLKKMKG
jgi:bleomycin hydrolase